MRPYYVNVNDKYIGLFQVRLIFQKHYHYVLSSSYICCTTYFNHDSDVSAMLFSHFLFVSDFTLLCSSEKSTAVQASLSFLFPSQDGCTHSYIIPLPSQTYTHFHSVVLCFIGLIARVCLGLNIVAK